MTTIKITALTDIGANIPNTTLIPVVDMTGTPTTDKATFGNVANAILSQAGNNYSAATKAVNVTASAQPNITSVGTLTELTVAANVTADFYFGDGGFLSNVTGGNAVPSGSNSQVQYNDNGAFGGDPGMTYNEGTSTLTANNFIATSNSYLGNISTTGSASITTLLVGATANLGAVGNVTITGGSNGQVLTTNGSNVLSWTTVSGGNSDYSNSNVANYLPTYTGNLSGGNLNVPSNLSFDINTNNGNGGTYAWTFSNDGKLYWPGIDDHSIYNGANNSFIIHAHNNVVISTDGANANYQYQFYANGDLGLPGNVSATVFSGNGSSLSAIAGANVTGTVGNANLSQYLDVSDVNNNFSYHVVLSAGSGDKSLHIDADDNLQYNPADGTLTATRVDATYVLADLQFSNGYPAANVTGLGNIATINLDGSNSNVLYGNGVFAPVSGGNPFDQDLNTTDNVQFANITSTDAIRFKNAGNLVGALGYAPTYVSIEGYGSNSVNITTNDVNTWTFNGDGTLSFPGNVAGESGNVLIDSADDNFEVRGAENINFEANATVNIYTDTSNNGFQWQFGDDGNLTLPGNSSSINYANGTPYGGGGSTGNVTFDDVTVQGDNNVLNLSAGPYFTANLAYLQLRAGDVASHIHLDTGNNEAYDLIVGNDQKYVQVSSTGNIIMSSYDSNTSQYIWTLDTTGNLILAGGNSVIQSVANSSLDPVNPNVSTMILTPDANYSSQSLVLDPTSPGHIHLRAPGTNIEEPLANIFLGGENSSFEVGVYNGSAPNLFIHSGGNTWTFGNDGTTTFPAGNITSGTSLQFTTTFANVKTVEYQTAGVWDLYVEDSITGSNTAASRLNVSFKDNLIDKPQVYIENTKESDGIALRWTFDENGNLNFPRDVAGNTDPFLTISGGANPRILSEDVSLVGPANLEITALNTIFTGASGSAIKIYPDDGEVASDGNLQIWSNVVGNTQYSWTFDTTGNLTLPGNTFAVNYANGTQVPLSGGGGLPLANGNSIIDIATLDGNITLDANGNTFTFGTDGNLTTPSNLVIGPFAGGGSSIVQYDSLLQVVGEGSNAITLMGWAANQSSPDSIAVIGMNTPYANGAANLLIAVGNNATTVNYWNFDNTGVLSVPGNIVGSNLASPAPYITGFSSVETLDGANIAGFVFTTSDLTLPGGTGVIESLANNVSIYNDSSQNNGIVMYNDGLGNEGIEIYGNSSVVIYTDFSNMGYQTTFQQSGNILTAGSIIPGTANTFDLGNSVNYFRDAYFSNNVVAESFATTDGGLTHSGSAVGINANAGKDVYLYADGANVGWTFDSAGNLTLPANTFSINFANGSQAALSSIANGTSNVVVASSGNVTVGVAGTGNVMTVTSTGANVTGTLNTTGNVTAQGTGSNLIRRAFGLVAADTYVTLDDISARVTSSTSQLSLILTSGSWQGTGWTETFTGGTPTVNNWVNLPLSTGYDNASGAMNSQGHGCRCVISDQTPSAKVYQITAVRSGTTGALWNISIERLV